MPRSPHHRARQFILALTVGVLTAGCASTPGDPLEPINRRIHTFNEAVDRTLLRPAAEGYSAVTPRPVSRSVTNFFSNLDDVIVLANSALQLKGRDTVATAYRLVFNTTIGVGGLFDVAGALGEPKLNEDFGQTLGSWGVPAGPYLVLPLLGPSTLRDAPALVVDWEVDPRRLITHSETRYGLLGLYAVDARAGLLGASDLFDTAATDPYAFMRDAWLSRRAQQVYDGDPPPGTVPGYQDDDFDPFDDDDDDLFD